MANLDCGTLAVPLDPAEPDGASIGIAVAGSQATGSSDERVGSLVINPGGPGGSGIQFLANAASTFPEELTDHFDLVSFDPRGVGASTPVRCLDDGEKDRSLSGDLSPDTAAELQQALDEQAELLDGCRTNSAELLTHMSTADVAADLDELREALGEEQLTYLGYSYGTSIGAVYATLFPSNVRALVLDGSVSPGASDEEQLLTQAKGFERTLANFVSACDADSDCPIGPDATATIAAARSALAQAPVEVTTDSGTALVGPDLFDLGVATALYDTSLWGTLASAIANLDDGGAATLLSLVDRQTGRQPDGTFDNSSDAQTMVSCADSPERPTAAEATAAAERIAAAAPWFGGRDRARRLRLPELARGRQPAAGDHRRRRPHDPGGRHRGDPATPYEWAEQMTAALGVGRAADLRGRRPHRVPAWWPVHRRRGDRLPGGPDHATGGHPLPRPGPGRGVHEHARRGGRPVRRGRHPEERSPPASWTASSTTSATRRSTSWCSAGTRSS